MTFTEALRALGGAQKAAARGAPLYSRFVNRKIGRVIAAAAATTPLTPNGVTMISALLTFSGIAVLALAPYGWGTGVLVTVLLVLGYATDSADGQLARLRGGGSPAGEWLDHVVDATKVVSLPLALFLGLHRAEAATWVLLTALAATVVQSVFFFTMILTEQLRRAHGTVPLAGGTGRGGWVRSLVAVPTDYGLQCYTFVLLGALPVFSWVYAVIVVATAGYLVLALAKWYRELRGLAR
jgi:phosphatidylglycerophosphate synthase